MTERPMLVVEDNDEDFQAVHWALQRLGRAVQLERCIDGDSALERLFAWTAPWPSVILLDLNLPGTDGLEVLTQLKRHPRLNVLPVLVLSTSAAEADVIACYAAGANGYLVKPVDFTAFTEQIRTLCDFWLDTAQLPHPAALG